MRVSAPQPEVAVDGASGALAEGTGALPASLAQHHRHVLVKVDVRNGKAGALAAAHPGIE